MDGDAVNEVMRKVLASVGVQKFSDERAVVVVPDGFSVKDIRDMLPPPARPVESIELLTAQSFIDYVGHFGDEQASVIFADESAGQYRAIIDFHVVAMDEVMHRGTCDHVARYQCPQSLQWQVWMGSNGKMVAQTDFARFIEDNLPDVIRPTAATMLQVAMKLQVKKDVQFASEVRLDNGQTQLRYEETIRGSTGAGEMVIPDTFTIRIPVFVGGPLYDIEARLRYRLHEGKLAIGYELVRPVLVKLDAIQKVTAEIREGLTDFALYIGKR